MKILISIIMGVVVSVSSLFANKVKSADIPDASGLKKNPLLLEWKTPHQTPPFAKIATGHYLPAIEYAVAVAKAEINSIANNSEHATFANTIAAFDASGRLLSEVSSVFFSVLGTDRTDEMSDISEKVMPMLTEYQNDIFLNENLFKRVKEVYKQRDNTKLTAEENMLLDNIYKMFARSGANLTKEEKEKYRAITKELSELSLNYSKNVLKETSAFELHLTNADQVEGLPESLLDQAKSKAISKQKEGWIIDLSPNMFSEFMKYSKRRDLRELLYKAYRGRAFGGNEYNNENNVKRIVELRLELAKILGYDTYASYVLEERMAKDVSTVNDFLAQLIEYSLPAAQKEMKQLADYAATKGLDTPLKGWDISYYMEKLKVEQYEISDEELKPYFELNAVKSGIFALVKRLYGLEFKENTKIEKYHKDVQIYEVYDADGRFMSVLYLDFFARETKRGGAWMTDFRGQYVNEDGKDVRPLVQLVLNFAPPASDGYCLLPYASVNTFLHEFGHALHGMLSDCTYAGTSGTNVPRDFVELPSQILENWITEKEFLDMFAKHYKTGEIIPAELVERIIKSEKYMAGYMSVKQLSYGVLDMSWHTITEPIKESVADFENKAVLALDLLPPVDGTNMSVQFGHIFSGGYASGYYGYKWAEVLEADAFSVFKDKGIFNSSVAASFRENILSKGGSEEPMDLYIKFRGHKPSIDALLERSGLK